jgi:hypothetical protein
VRQGQKLKAQALQQSLIQETIEITKTGRIAAVTLTDKGMVIVSGSQKRELDGFLLYRPFRLLKRVRFTRQVDRLRLLYCLLFLN